MNPSRFSVVLWLTFILILVALMHLLGAILTPFVSAAILAYICNPLVLRCSGKKISRSLAVVLVMTSLFLSLALLLLIMLPLLHKETGLFIERLPEWIDVLRLHIIPRLQLWLGSDFQMDSGAVKGALITHWQSAEGVAAKVLPWLGTSGGVLITMFINLLLIPLAMFYFLRDWNNLLSKIDQLIPRHCYCKVKEITLEVDTVLAEFLRGQISVMFLMSLYYVTLLWCVGLEFALPIGIVAGVLVFIPYIGMMTGLTLATLAASMQFTSLSNVMIVWAVFGAGQLIEGMFVTPRLVGERVGLHPLVVIFSLLAFGQLFGFFGVLLALPLAAIVLVTLRHVRTWYFTSTMYIRK